MNFSSRPVEIRGRTLPCESLKFGNGTKQLNFRADWGNDMKGTQLLNCVPLREWIVICPSRQGSAGEKFLKHYGNVIHGMGIAAEAPETYFINSICGFFMC